LNILFVTNRDSERNWIHPLAEAICARGHTSRIADYIPLDCRADVIHDWTGTPSPDLPGIRIAHLDDTEPSSADGYTYHARSVAILIPPGKPSLELLPATDPHLFFPRPLPRTDGRILGIHPATTVIAYAGDVHEGNAHRIRSLYLAVAILQREGHPAILVRTGSDHYPFLGPDPSWGRGLSIELGPVDRTELPAILSLADLFVIPGRPGDANSHRFPAKLAEILPIGRPVILPQYEFTAGMVDGQDACLLAKADGRAIAAAVRRIMGDSNLYQSLAGGALRFSAENLNVDRSAERLLHFYRQFQP
jgi:hypothetical protein